MFSPSSFSLLDLYPLHLTTPSDDDSRVYSLPKLDLMHHAKTLYLFTKSDIKTIIIPVTLFASMLAPIDSYSRIWTTFVWIWVHLLHFCIANQCFSVSEDASNKPWRPIPSGRITPRQASLIRWALAPACLSISSAHGTLPASCTLLVATWLYNDMGFHEHGVIKNILNVIGYVAFEAGATMVAAWDGHIHGGAVQALGLSGVIILTTVHAGDIPDVDGDLTQGRRTLPILFPKSIRPVLAATLLAWSAYGSSLIWSISRESAILLFALGVFVSWRFLAKTSGKQDKTSCLLYNIWLSGMHFALAVGADNIHWSATSASI